MGDDRSDDPPPCARSRPTTLVTLNHHLTVLKHVRLYEIRDCPHRASTTRSPHALTDAVDVTQRGLDLRGGIGLADPYDSEADEHLRAGEQLLVFASDDVARYRQDDGYSGAGFFVGNAQLAVECGGPVAYPRDVG